MQPWPYTMHNMLTPQNMEAGCGKNRQEDCNVFTSFLYTFSINNGFCGQNQCVCTFGWASSGLWIPKEGNYSSKLSDLLPFSSDPFPICILARLTGISSQAELFPASCQVAANYIGSSGALLFFLMEAALYDSSIANHPCFMSTSKLLITRGSEAETFITASGAFFEVQCSFLLLLLLLDLGQFTKILCLVFPADMPLEEVTGSFRVES